jgi:hypothetical protein
VIDTLDSYDPGPSPVRPSSHEAAGGVNRRRSPVRRCYKETMAVPLELRTERLSMTRLTAAHLEDLVRLDSDPEVMRYINGGIPTPREQVETEILPRIRA